MSLGIGLSPQFSGPTSGGGASSDPELDGPPETGENGSYVSFFFNEDMDETSTPSVSDFSFGGTALVTPDTPAWFDARELRIPTVGVVLVGDTLTATYVEGSNPIQDTATNPFGSFVDMAVANMSEMVLTGVIRTLMASETVSGLAAGSPLTLISWGAGSGGDWDNETGFAAAGAGGACAVTEIASGEESYDFVAGVGGDAGTLGTATAGTASSWSDSGGVVNQANGGTPGIAHATTPTASVGGTGGVGDTINNGGAGATGPGNITGGGAAGTSTAASGTTGGTPNGVRGTSGTGLPPPGTGGPVGTSGTPRAGGAGFGRIAALKIADLSYPFFDREPTLLVDTTNLTSRNLVRAGTHVSDDRLIVIAAIDGADGGNDISGWTKLCDQADAGDACTLAIFGINSTGSEALAFTSATEQGTFWMFRVKNAAPPTDWSITAASKASGTNSNPPSHTHPAGSKPILWITTVAFDGTSATAANNMGSNLFPTGWDFMTIWSHPRGINTATPGLLIAAKVSTASTEDPPVFTHGVATVGGIATMAIPLLGS